MIDPVSASEVTRETDKDEDDLRRERAQMAVRGRLVKREALRRAGGLASTDTPGGMEDRLKNIEAQQMAAFRERSRA